MTGVYLITRPPPDEARPWSPGWRRNWQTWCENELRLYPTILEAGIDVLQLRVKDMPLRAVCTFGRPVGELCRRFGVKFLVNDRCDLALALEADGVHLGEQDLTIPTARRVVGDGMLLGRTVRNSADAVDAFAAGADYCCLGPLARTSTKELDIEPVGIAGLEEARSAVTGSLGVIGGVTPELARLAVSAGADFVAVVSSVFAAEDPAAAVSALRRPFVEDDSETTGRGW